MQPHVSVIIPTRNRGHVLLKAINSVFSQTYQDYEIIVINDASTDNTVELLQQLTKKDSRVRYLSHAMVQGGSVSRNLGIYQSKGKWIAFLDDDDTWRPDKLQEQLDQLESNPTAIACSANYCVHYPFYLKKNIYISEKITLERLLQSNCYGGASVCICLSSVIKAFGGFDAALKSSQDWDVWIKLFMRGTILSTTRVLVDYRVHFHQRISNNMHSKYLGARLFYFKYRKEMDITTQNIHFAFLCFIKSRQPTRTKGKRIKYLLLAISHSHVKVGWRYLISSLPRILLASAVKAVN